MVVNWKKSLARQQILMITPVVLLVVLILAYYLSEKSTELLRTEIELRTQKSSEMSAAKLDAIFSESARTAKVIAEVIEDNVYTDDELKNFLVETIESLRKTRPEVSGGSIAFAPYMRDEQKKSCMWYTHFKNEKQEIISVDSDEYDYFSFNWYRHADRFGGSWSEPYFDDGLGNILMATYACPIFTHKGKTREFAGFVTIDISLPLLKHYLDNSIGIQGYAFLLSSSGRIVVHPNSGLVMKYTVFNTPEAKEAEYREFWETILAADSGCLLYPYKTAKYNNTDAIMSYSVLPTNGWLVGEMISSKELFKPLVTLQKYASILAVSAITLAMLLLGFLMWRALRPLRILAPVAWKIGSGDFSAQLPKLNRSDEVGQLNNAFGVMQNSLQQYVSELKITTANRNRIESELAISHQIQQSLLPQLCTLPSERNEYKLFAALRPAKGVGGDLYDYFFISENELCIAIGDVSGKGIPGALFMAITQTLHRGIAAAKLSSGEIVSKINSNLSKNNDMMMFVTYFFGILNLDTGVMQYTNAGHNPPLIRKNDGSVELLSGIQGPPMAIVENEYPSATHTFSPGDLFLLYTDGVTEAINNCEKEFSLEQLKNILANASNPIEPEALVHKIIRSVFTHAGTAEQFDDITLLALRCNRFEKSSR